MPILLGNTVFKHVRESLGYQLTEDDKKLWDKYHNNRADLSGKESSFHIFEIPTVIHFKGKEAGEAIKRMFTPDKLVEEKGEFKVVPIK